MACDRLESLLRAADRMAGPPPAERADLPARVRRLASRRTRQRITGGALAGCLGLATACAWMQLSSRPMPAAHAGPGEAFIQQQLMAIAREADGLRLSLAVTVTAESNSDPSHALALADIPSSPDIDQQIERTAYLAVYQGDRYHRDLDMPQAALTSYRDTIRLFPRTRAAKIARARLEEFQNEKDNAL